MGQAADRNPGGLRYSQVAYILLGKREPNNASAHYLLGTAYRALGRKTEAEREFELSRGLHPKAEP